MLLGLLIVLGAYLAIYGYLRTNYFYGWEASGRGLSLELTEFVPKGFEPVFSPLVRLEERVQDRFQFVVQPAGFDDFTYVVVDGDSIRSLAATFVTTERALKRRNPGLTDEKCKPGVELIIPPLDEPRRWHFWVK